MVKKENIERDYIKSQKTQTFIQVFVIIIILVLINIISQYFYKRIDLTKDKRFSLSDTSLEIIKSLDDIVYVKVYLEGDLPAGFRRLK